MNKSKFINVIGLLVISVFTGSFSRVVTAEKTCEYPLAAEYRYTIMDSANDLQQQKSLTLWRRDKQVIIQMPNSQQSELWELTKNNQLKMTRFFEDHQRGIEYQPGEIKSGREKNDWSMKYQLVSDLLIAKMYNDVSLKRSQSKLEDCKKNQRLSMKERNKTIELLWNPQEKLMESLVVKEGSVTTQWALHKKISDVKMINHYFDDILNYQTTDYADIGDNESDPFLLKMINLGFVEHGASGFYDSAGNILGDQERGNRHRGH